MPARADWEGTHWGDSVEKVIASAGDGTRLDQGGKDDRVWNQDQRASRLGDYHGIAAQWLFFFDRKGGLSIVKIKPQNQNDCPAFLAASEAPLGEPAKVERKQISFATFISKHWADKERNLAILVFSLPGALTLTPSCHIIFEPYGKGKPSKRK